MRPTKSVPGGCVISLFGLGALAFAGLSFYCAWLLHSRFPERFADHALDLAIVGGVALLLGVILLLAGLKLAREIDSDYDPDDPDEPKVKF